MEESPSESGSVALWVVWITVCGDTVLTAPFRLSTLSGGGNINEDVVLVEEVRLTGLPMTMPPFSRCGWPEVVCFSGLALAGTICWSPWLLGISMTEVLSPEGSWVEYSDGRTSWRASYADEDKESRNLLPGLEMLDSGEAPNRRPLSSSPLWSSLGLEPPSSFLLGPSVYCTTTWEMLCPKVWWECRDCGGRCMPPW